MYRALILFLVAWILSGATHYRVACGGPGGTDSSGNTWIPDGSFAVGGSPTGGIAGKFDFPYNRSRFSQPPGTGFTYSFMVPPGSYRVTFKFIEPSKVIAGQRIFSVSINGVVVLSNIDLFAVAGLHQPKDYTLPVASPDGKIIITLTAQIGNALISGIQIDSVPSPSYFTGTEASIPQSCPPGLSFFFAADTGRLFWCAGTRMWSMVNSSTNQTTAQKMGTLVNGVCSSEGTGFHFDTGSMRSNEPAANCILQ